MAERYQYRAVVDGRTVETFGDWAEAQDWAHAKRREGTVVSIVKARVQRRSGTRRRVRSLTQGRLNQLRRLW